MQGILDLLVPKTVNNRVQQGSDDGVGHREKTFELKGSEGG